MAFQAKPLPFHMGHVGSFLRPAELKAARQQFEAGEIDQAALAVVERKAIAEVVEQQIAAGLPEVTSAEFNREWWHFSFMWELLGAQKIILERGYQFKGIETKPHHVGLTGKLAWNREHPFIADFVNLKQLVGDRAVAKQTIPSPGMFFDPLIRKAALQFYPDFEAFAEDLAQAYKDAIQHFYDVGCRYLQLDDCFLAYLCDSRAAEQEEAIGYSLEKMIALSARTLELALKDKPADLYVSMHICRGNFASHFIYEGGYAAIIDSLAQIKLDTLFLEFDDARSGGFDVLAKLPSQNVVLGLVCTKHATLEDVPVVKARIQEAAQFLPLSRLGLSGQCGFASTEEGNAITEADQWQKLALIKSIVDDVWKQ